MITYGAYIDKNNNLICDKCGDRRFKRVTNLAGEKYQRDIYVCLCGNAVTVEYERTIDNERENRRTDFEGQSLTGEED